MAFIISKTSIRGGNPRKLYYLVSNYRENGKIKRKPMLSMGEYRTLEEFKNHLSTKKAELETQLDQAMNQHKVPRFIMIGRSNLLSHRLESWLIGIKNKITECDKQLACIAAVPDQT